MERGAPSVSAGTLATAVFVLQLHDRFTQVAVRLGLRTTLAETILREVFLAVSAWRGTGRKLRLRAATLETYASALEHEWMDEARRLLKAGPRMFQR